MTIILFGESVIIIASTLSDLQWTATTIGATVAGFVMMSTIWWLYFDLMENHLSGKALKTGQHIIYGHLFIYSGLSILAVFIGFSIAPELTMAHHLLLFALGFSLLSIGFMMIFSASNLFKRDYRLPAIIFTIAVISIIFVDVKLVFSVNSLIE